MLARCVSRYCTDGAPRVPHPTICLRPSWVVFRALYFPRTITHNNRSAELLATIRRGPFARPTQDEKVEYLLTRVHKAHSNVQFSEHALEHVLSYQRRVHAIKQDFLHRRKMTPLGITAQWWDRTEVSVPCEIQSDAQRAPPGPPRLWCAARIVLQFSVIACAGGAATRKLARAYPRAQRPFESVLCFASCHLRPWK